MSQSYGDIVQIRGLIVHHYALLEPDGGVILLDGGFMGDAVGRIETALNNHDRNLDDVRAIILTHGHIDHTLRIAELKRRTGAPVFAPKVDADHISGTYSYRGIARICGAIEKLARFLYRYEVPEIDHWFEPGDSLDFFGGLEVIGLPGHSLGHCGFLQKSRNALFAADLFANFYYHAKTPPPWFNVDSKLMRQSIVKAADLCDAGTQVFPSHCHTGGPNAHRLDLKKLAARFSR